MTDQPELLAVGSAFWVVWKDKQITLEFSRIAEHTETLTAEVSVISHDVVGEVAWSRINLLAGQARAGLAKACIAMLAETDWAYIVERSCRLVLRHLRAGQPPVHLRAIEPLPEWVADRWLIPHLCPRNQITVLYGDGGQGKSWLALALAVSGLLGHPLSPVWTVGTLRRVMYLDWESAVEDHQERLWRLTTALEALAPDAILYHRLHRPLTDHVDQLAAEVDKEHVDLVITDSLGAACGSEPETNDAALRTMGALRSIGSTSLVLAHVSKAMTETTGPRRPFGGVYVVNTARSTIEARRMDADEETTLTVTLHHRKSNAGRLARTSALQFAWEDSGAVTVMGVKPDIADSSLNTRILAILSYIADDAKSSKAIAVELKAPHDSVTRALRRLKEAGTVCETRTGGGRGKESLWIHVDTTRTEE